MTSWGGILHPQTVPSFRLTLFRGSGQHVLVLSRHAMLMDGWSVETFARELFAWDHTRGRGDMQTMAPPFQYADYCVWQRRLLRGAGRHRLCRMVGDEAGAWPLTGVTPDRTRPARPVCGAAVNRDLPRATVDGLLRMAHQEAVTLFMLLLLAYRLAIGARTGIDDLVQARRSPIAGATSWKGCLASLLCPALRTPLPHTLHLIDALRAVRDTTLDAFEHQGYRITDVAALIGSPPESVCPILFVLHISNRPDRCAAAT